MVWHVKPDLDASLLPSECHWARQIFNHSLIEVAFVHENESLWRYQAEEDLVEHAELGEREEED